MNSSSSDQFADLVRSNRKTRDSALLRATTDLFTLDMDHSREEIRQFEELATHLLPKVAAADRKFVAERLASIGDAPASLLRALARDDVAIAAPIIRQSPALTPFDLMCIIAATGEEHHRLIAARPSLNDDVIRALSRTGSMPVDEEQTAEIGAEIGAELAESQAEIADSIDGQEKDAFKAGWGFLDLGREARLAAVAAFAATEPGLEEASGEARAALRKIVTAAQVIGLARTGQTEQMVDAIAESLGLPAEFVAASVSDPTGEPLAILLRALRLDNATAQQVMLLASPVGRQTAAFFALADIHAGMEPAVATGMIEAWRGAEAKPIRHEQIVQDQPSVRTERIHRETTPAAARRTGDKARRAS